MTEQAHLLPDRPKTLMGKINALYAHTDYIVFDTKNDHDNYRYASEAAILEAIRSHAAALGLVILPPSAESLQVVSEVGMKSPLLFVHYTNTIGHVDGEDVITAKSFGGANLNAARDKAPYVSQTGDSKYFLQKLGLLPSYDSEPDSNENSEPGTTGAGTRAEAVVDYQSLADQIYNYLEKAPNVDKLAYGLAQVEPRIADLKAKAPQISKELARRVKKLQESLGGSRAEGVASDLADQAK